MYACKIRARVFSSEGLGITWRLGIMDITLATSLKSGDIVTLHVELAHGGTHCIDHPVPWIQVPSVTHDVDGKLQSCLPKSTG